MKQRVFRIALIFISSMLLVSGFLALWFFFPLILNKFGGFNIVSFGLTLFFALSIVLFSTTLFIYGQGSRFRRWRLEVALTCFLLAIEICLAFLYDMLLSSIVPAFWRYFILPLATLIAVFYVLRSIPKIREKLDKLSQGLLSLRVFLIRRHLQELT
jgi:hypothetical protein